VDRRLNMVGRFRDRIEKSSSSKAGYVWLLSSDDEGDLIGLQSSFEPGMRAVRFDSFPDVLDLGSEVTLRYYARVDNVPKAVASVQQLLRDLKVSEDVFMVHAAVAATAVETSGVEVRERRSFFASRQHEASSAISDSARTSRQPAARSQTVQRLRDLSLEVENSIAAAESLLAESRESLRPVEQVTVEAPADNVTPIKPPTPAGPAPSLRTGGSGVRGDLSQDEILALEGMIISREAKQRVRYLRGRLIKSVLQSTFFGTGFGLVALLALNPKADPMFMVTFLGAGFSAGLILALLVFSREYGNEFRRWRRTFRATRQYANA